MPPPIDVYRTRPKNIDTQGHVRSNQTGYASPFFNSKKKEVVSVYNLKQSRFGLVYQKELKVQTTGGFGKKVSGEGYL